MSDTTEAGIYKMLPDIPDMVDELWVSYSGYGVFKFFEKMFTELYPNEEEERNCYPININIPIDDFSARMTRYYLLHPELDEETVEDLKKIKKLYHSFKPEDEILFTAWI